MTDQPFGRDAVEAMDSVYALLRPHGEEYTQAVVDAFVELMAVLR